MEVVLHGTLLPHGERCGLDPVNDCAECALHEVEHEDGNAPPLVVVVEVHRACGGHGRDPERNARDYDRGRWNTQEAQPVIISIRPHETRSGRPVPRPNWNTQ